MTAGTAGAPAPQHHYIKVRDVLLHVLEWPGPGRPLLLVHGLNAHAGIWRHIARDLQGAAGRHLVAVDLRGHGASDQPATGYKLEDYTEDMAALIQALGLQRPVVLGLSLGARVAIYLAATHPNQVGGIGVGDIGAAFTPEQLAGLTARMNAYPFAGTDRAQYRAAFAQCYPTLPKDTADLWFDTAVQLGPQGGYQWNAARHAVLETVARWNDTEVVGKLGNIRCPVLLLKGGASGTMSADQAQLLLQKIPGAKLQVLEGLGHHVSLEGPRVYLEAVAGLLG